MKRVVSLASSTYQSFSSTFLIQSFVCFMEDSLTNILGVLSCTNLITYHAQEFVEVSRMCLKWLELEKWKWLDYWEIDHRGNVFRIYTFVLIEKIYPLNTCFNIFIFISLYTTKIYSGYPNWLWSWQKYKARGSTFSKSFVPLSSHCRGNSKINFFGEGVVRWLKIEACIYYWYWKQNLSE